MIKQENITIIIPHLGKTPEQKYSLVQCLLSLEETVPDMKKILIVNGHNPSDPEEVDYIQKLKHQQELMYPNLEIEVISSQGQCRAVNLGAVLSCTEWIFITNDDMVYPANWFDRLVELIDDTKPVCVSPTLVEPRPGAPTFLTYFCGGAGGDFDIEKFKEYVGEYYLTVAPHLKTGFNLPLLINLELWNLVEGYDLNYDPWGSNSDSDLEYKIKLAGVQPQQVRHCVVYHFSQTSGTFEPQNHSYWEKNFKYFEDKWGFPRTDHRIWEADFEIPDEGRIFRPEWEGKYKNEN